MLLDRISLVSGKVKSLGTILEAGDSTLGLKNFWDGILSPTFKILGVGKRLFVLLGQVPWVMLYKPTGVGWSRTITSLWNAPHPGGPAAVNAPGHVV